MSNLLTGLALALGGGLQGYAQGKELQRRARMEEEEQAARRKREDEQRQMRDLELALQGVYRDGQEPGASNKVVTPEGRQVLGAMAASLGAGGAMPVPGLQDTLAKAPNAFRDRYQSLVPGYRQDVTRTADWKDQETQRVADEKEATKAREIDALMQRAMQPGGAGRLARAQLRRYNITLPEPSTNVETQTDARGFLYRRNPEDGQLTQEMGPDGKPFRASVPSAGGGYNGQVVETRNGTVLVDPRTGKVTPLTMPDGSLLMGTTGQKETEGERKVRSLRTMATNAYNRLVTVDPQTGERSWAKLPTRQGRAVQLITPERFETDVMGVVGLETDQAISQSVGQLVESWLRYVSGAAVPETEVRRYANLYAPRATDSDEVKANKLSAVTAMLQALSHSPGGTMPPTEAMQALEAEASAFGAAAPTLGEMATRRRRP